MTKNIFLLFIFRILHLLRLLQVSNPEKIFNEIQELYPNNNNSWTFDGKLIISYLVFI